jgi:hypothetical protein
MCDFSDESTTGGTSTAEPDASPSTSRRTGQPFSPIARRLALLIALVALVALALLAIATLVFANNDVTTLSGRQRADLGRAVASAVKVSYEQSQTWNAADLSPALALASQAGIAVQVRDQSGALVDSAIPRGIRPSTLGPPLIIPIETDGAAVGTDSVRTSTAGIGAADSSLRRARPLGSDGAPSCWRFLPS